MVRHNFCSLFSAKRLPFEITFLSDGVENSMTAPSEVANNGLQNGFQIEYELSDCDEAKRKRK